MMNSSLIADNRGFAAELTQGLGGREEALEKLEEVCRKRDVAFQRIPYPMQRQVVFFADFPLLFVADNCDTRQLIIMAEFIRIYEF